MICWQTSPTARHTKLVRVLKKSPTCVLLLLFVIWHATSRFHLEPATEARSIKRKAIVLLKCFKRGPRQDWRFHTLFQPIGSDKVFQKQHLGSSDALKNEKTSKAFQVQLALSKTFLAHSKSWGEKLLCFRKDNGNFLKNAFFSCPDWCLAVKQQKENVSLSLQ